MAPGEMTEDELADALQDAAAEVVRVPVADPHARYIALLEETVKRLSDAFVDPREADRSDSWWRGE